MTASDLVNYYVGLLIMQFFGLPKASGMIAAFVGPAVSDLIVLQVRAGFNLATATGRQLDALGQIVGLRRSAPGFASTEAFFKLEPYVQWGSGGIGFSRYPEGPTPGLWWRYADVPDSFIMSDALFAQLIRFVVAVRASDYSLDALDAIFFAFFDDNVQISDNGDMTMTYNHDSTDPGVLFPLIAYLKLLPHPAGVAYTVVEV